MIFDLIPGDTTSAQRMFAGSHTDTPPYQRNYVSYIAGKFDIGVGSGRARSNDSADTNRCTVEASTEFDNIYLKVNDKNLAINWEEYPPTFDYSKNPFWIFHVNSTYSAPLIGKIYNAYIDIINVAQLDLRPMKRLSDGIVGFYDVNNDKFYENAGTGEFIPGPMTGNALVHPNELIKPASMKYINRLFGKDVVTSIDDRPVSAHILKKIIDRPVTYTQLQYIEFDGNQYIRTNFYPGWRKVIQFKCMLYDGMPDTVAIFGGRDTSRNNALAVWKYYGNKTRFDYQYNKTELNYELNNNIDLNIEISNTTITINSYHYYMGGTGSDWSNNNNPIILGSIQSTGGNADGNGIDTRRMVGRIYSCKMYEKGSASPDRNFIPVKTNTGEVGLLETVENIFYKNMGTGKIKAGPEI